MTDTTPSYYDLRIEDTCIDYLRTRLPYSFNHIEEKRREGASPNSSCSQNLICRPGVRTLTTVGK